MDLERVKRVGVAAAFKGAGVLLHRMGRIENVRRKGANDLVTEADTGSERIMIDTILRAFPEHRVVAEESGQTGDGTGCWIIDPLDGTTNYAHGLEIFSISLAFAKNEEPLVGIVLDPVRGELYTAVKGCGARLNGRPLKVSGTLSVSESLLVTGFPYSLQERIHPILTRFSNCLKSAQGMRRLGSAALDLCYVAGGRFDGFWESHLKPWDIAAGMLMVREAGGRVTDYSGRDYTLSSDGLLATNGSIHDEMLALLSVEESR
jgi:myo-inositol-1(or 4)-monophosphatase